MALDAEGAGAPTSASAEPARRRTPPAWVTPLAAWVGLANLLYVLLSAVLRQLVSLPDLSGGPNPLGSARDTALTGVIAGVLALLTRRLRWPSLALAGLFGLWAAAETVSAWVVTDQLIARPIWLALTGAGLALGTAVARPLLTGWTIYSTACVYVWVNLYVMWQNYTTVGSAFPGSATWWGPTGWVHELPERPEWAPDPAAAGPAVLWRLLTDDIPRFRFGGLGSNSGLTGNFAAFLIVFMVPFILSRGREVVSSRPVTVLAGRGAMLLFSAVPGVLLLNALNARSPLAGVLVGWAALAIPSRWLRRGRAASAAAVLVPSLMLLPVILARLGFVSLTGRDCVWASWWIGIRDSLLWGRGPTGGFPGVACDAPWWAHSHNQLLQALWVSGILGVLTAISVLAGLAWFAVRFRDRDHGILLSTMVCAALLLGVEVITSHLWNWIGLGMAALIAISARSVQMMAYDHGGGRDSAPTPHVVGHADIADSDRSAPFA